MSKRLYPGDRVSFVQKGRNLKGLVVDALRLRVAGRILIPIVRPYNRKKTRVRADEEETKPIHQKLRWMKRKDLTKLQDGTNYR